MEGMEEDGSSHLQRCFQRADDWPSQGLSQAEDLADLQNHEREFCGGARMEPSGHGGYSYLYPRCIRYSGIGQRSPHDGMRFRLYGVLEFSAALSRKILAFPIQALQKWC